ncbi:MAG: DUF3089 domain-containing protein [Chitinophagales bacterium]
MKWIGLIITAVAIGGSTPDAPDYALQKYWAALPNKVDKADLVPANTDFVDNQKNAKVDVFFIHPTTYYRSYSGNGDTNDDRLNEFTDEQTLTNQASVYNGSAKIYAPRYRQAALHNFFKRDDSKAQKAFNIAYSDVKRSFEYYLKHYNNGRPIIIAGHSQGSMHGDRLIREFFDGKALQNKLVAAYLIGYNIPKDGFSFISVCDDPTQTNCIISYNTFGWESDPNYYDYSKAICVNPINWRKDGKDASKSEHKGGVPKTFDQVDENMLSCKCNNGILWITKPKERGYVMMGGKNYHMVDYNLFYKDIRLNVADRVKAYLEKN